VKRVNKACVEFALANAIAKADRPVLTQYAIERSPNKQISDEDCRSWLSASAGAA
jgi:hypothetical protein